MKDLLKKIENWFKKMGRKEPSYDKPSIKPVRDWFKILVVAQILIAVSAIFAFYFYWKIDKGELFNYIENQNGNEIKINSDLLQKTLDRINAREDRFNEAKIRNIAPIDPSI